MSTPFERVAGNAISTPSELAARDAAAMSTETITREELVAYGKRNRYVDDWAERVLNDIEDHRESGAPQPEGVYCLVQIKGYQEHTGWLTEGTFCGVPYAFLRDRDGREIAKFPPDSVHLILPATELADAWQRPALPAADDDLEGSPF